MPSCKYKSIPILLLGMLSWVVTQSQTTNSPVTQNKPAAASGTSPVQLPPGYSTGISVNYIRVWEPRVPFTDANAVLNATNVADVNRSTNYFDGLGRPLQTVQWQTSPAKKDMVAPVVYDEFGREQYKFLPYTSTENDGLLKTNPFTGQSGFYNTTYSNQQAGIKGEQYYYSHTVFESSPLNRVEKSFAPGNSWAGSEGGTSEHAVKYKYLINNANDLVRIWNIGSSSLSYQNNDETTNIPASGSSDVYAAGELYKTVTLDEQEHAVVEYKDKEGKVILKKVQAGNTVAGDYSGHGAEWLCTYYVYDDLGQLRFVIQPKAVAQIRTTWQLTSNQINELCFRYEYDSRQRMIAKKVPGAAWIYMVYDIRDRLVFTQDGNLRSKGSNGNNSINGWWMATLYDALNRPVQTGLMRGYTGNRDQLQAVVNSQLSNQTLSSTSSLISSTPSDLTISVRETGRSLYQASSSIVLQNEFTDEGNAEYTAEIVSGSEETSSTQQTISLYPVPAEATLTALTYTYYDNYDHTTLQYHTTHNSKLDIGNNPYGEPLPASKSNLTRGMVTGTKVRVLENASEPGEGKWLEAVNFYDDKGLLIQSQYRNYKGGVDILTTRYDFKGLPVCTYSVHNNAAGNQSNLRVKTTIDYDHAGRVLQVRKEVNDDASASRLIVRNEYDEMGQLLRKKQGQKRGSSNTLSTDPLNQNDYTYNIRGWLKGINWGGYGGSGVTAPQTSIAANKWFGMDLSYDWGYEKNQYNGNISGQRWQSMGDGEERSFGYGYDHVNRLLYGDFNQNYGSGNSSNWAKDNDTRSMDFSIKMGDGINADQAYDENGNIKRMQQWGWKAGNGKTRVDDLLYTYTGNNNKLSYVNDQETTDHKLGDFTDKNTAADDYAYDVNGNLVQDKNKSISSISYNYLNLPQTITVEGKGTITYIYDATGNKLEKRTVDNTAGGQTNYTTYMAGNVYENNVLQFIGMEEGRIRPVFSPGGGAAGGWAYDYMVKDHLGNVRMVLTDEQKTNQYPAATMEDAMAATEEQFYSNLNTTRSDKPPGYPEDNYSNPNNKVAKLMAADGYRKIGPGIALKVMAGDKFSVRVSSWYKLNGATPGTPVNPLFDLLGALSGGVGNISGGKVTAAELNTSNILSPGATQFLNNQGYSNTTKPKAYLNWILFDEQLNFVSSSSNSDPVGESEEFKIHQQNDLPVTKNGYLYVYVSNETPNIAVFFDNLQVTHTRGPILEETHYYPFGLTMSGISSKAAGTLVNREKTFQGQRFDDELGLNWIQFKWRNHDVQIGRFIEIDPLAEDYVYNSTYAFSENKVTGHVELEGLEAVPYENQGRGESTQIKKPPIIINTPVKKGTSQPAITVTLSKGRQFGAKVAGVGGDVNFGSKEIFKVTNKTTNNIADKESTKKGLSLGLGPVGLSKDVTSKTTTRGTDFLKRPIQVIESEVHQDISVGIKKTPFSIGLERTWNVEQVAPMYNEQVTSDTGPQPYVGGSVSTGTSGATRKGTEFSLSFIYKVEVNINLKEVFNILFDDLNRGGN